MGLILPSCSVRCGFQDNCRPPDQVGLCLKKKRMWVKATNRSREGHQHQLNLNRRFEDASGDDVSQQPRLVALLSVRHPPCCKDRSRATRVRATSRSRIAPTAATSTSHSLTTTTPPTPSFLLATPLNLIFFLFHVAPLSLAKYFVLTTALESSSLCG